jgi:ADP-ribose pyrophosphatase YjhB (NUDIX family)
MGSLSPIDSEARTPAGRGYPAAAHTADAVVLRVAGDELQTLLWQRREVPFLGAWALPGGYLVPGESLEASARRHLREKVGLVGVGHLEQLETRSEPERDPRGWTVTTAFLALAAPDAEMDAPPDTAWHPVAAPPPLAFDHGELLALATARLLGKATYTNIAFALVDEPFTIAELRRAYEAVLGYAVSATNLQRVLQRAGILESTGERRAPAGGRGRPAELFRFTQRSLTVSKPLAAFRPPRAARISLPG